jgi:hypothetical protein
VKPTEVPDGPLLIDTDVLWTAACALAQPRPLPIVTNNLNDFQAIAKHFPLRLVHPDI